MAELQRSLALKDAQLRQQAMQLRTQQRVAGEASPPTPPDATPPRTRADSTPQPGSPPGALRDDGIVDDGRTPFLTQQGHGIESKSDRAVAA